MEIEGADAEFLNLKVVVEGCLVEEPTRFFYINIIVFRLKCALRELLVQTSNIR